MKTKLKLFIKSFIPLLGYFLSVICSEQPNKNDWQKRILIIFGGGIGDVVKRSVICNFLKEYLSDYEIYYLLPYKLKFPYAKEIFYFDYSKAKINPFYFLKLVSQLKKIGFSKIIVLLPFWENFLWILGKGIKPDRLYVSLEIPPSFFEVFLNKLLYFLFLKKNLKLVRVPSFFDRNWSKEIFPSDVFKQSFFISRVIKDINPKISIDEQGILKEVKLETQILIEKEFEEKYLENLKKDYSLEKENYCIIGLGSSASFKNWEPEKFAEVANWLKEKGFEVVLVGGKESEKLVEKFKQKFKYSFINLIEKTDLEQLSILIKNSKLVLSNDTSFVHIGIAFRKPTFCLIINTDYLGVDSLYGYENLNFWIFPKEKGKNSLEKLTPQEVIEKIELFFNNPRSPSEFKLSFLIKIKK